MISEKTAFTSSLVRGWWSSVLIVFFCPCMISINNRVRPRSAGPKLALFGGIVDRSSTPKLGFEGRHVPLRSCRGLVEFQSPSAAHGLRRDAGLVMKTAFLAPHAPRPCLPVWPCLGHACPRVLPVTTLHDDGLLGRAARRFVKKKRPKMVCTRLSSVELRSN